MYNKDKPELQHLHVTNHSHDSTPASVHAMICSKLLVTVTYVLLAQVAITDGACMKGAIHYIK